MRRITDDVWMLSLAPRCGMNVYVIDDSTGSVLIDAGTHRSAKKILAALKGRSVSALALTHVHPDHHGGSHRVTAALDAPLWAPASEAVHAEIGETRELAPRSMILELQQRFWQGPGVPVQRRLVEGDSIGAGFVAIETPGHSPGHLAFWRERDGVLILGDVLWHMHPLTGRPGLREPPRMFTLDPAQNRESIRRLAAMKPQTVCFGHGPSLQGAGVALDRFVGTLDARRRSVPREHLVVSGGAPDLQASGSNRRRTTR